MTSKLVVNTIEADTGISSVSFASSISMSSTSKFHFSNAGIDIGADTNINRPAAGVLGFNINSAEKFRIDSSGHIKAVGVCTATHFYGDGSNLTGISGVSVANQADNRLITATGTTDALNAESSLTYDGTKVLNITSSAGGFFQGTDSDGGIGLLEMGNGDVAIQADTGNSINNSKIHFFLDGSEKLRITSAGRLGIGEDNPDSLLHLKAGNDRSSIRLENTYDTPDNVWELQPGISGVSNTGFCIRDITDSANRFVIDGNGNIGINDNSPPNFTGYKSLSIHGSTGGALVFGDDGTDEWEIYGGDGVLKIYDRANTSERLRITSAGDVGIGYNSPTVKLHIREAASGYSGTYDNRYHCIIEDDAEAYYGVYVPNNGYGGLRFHRAGGGASATAAVGYIDCYMANEEMHYYCRGSGTSGKHIFSTGGSQRLSIDSNGLLTVNGNADFNVTNGELDIYSTGSGDQLSLRLLNSDASAGNKIGIYFGPANNVAGAYIKGVAESDFTSTANRDAGLELGTRLNANFLAPLKISAAGYVTKTETPCFIVRHTNAENYSAGSYVDGPWTVTLNRGSHFNTSNGIFTAPIAGLYQLNMMMNNDYNSTSTPGNFKIHVNNSLYAGMQFDPLDSHNRWFTHVLTGTLNLSANDTVRLYSGNASRVDNYNWNHWSMYLVG